MKKRILGVLLAAALTLSAWTPALGAAAPFPDITDAQTRVEVDTLRMMGVISGDNLGNFNPSGSLTRAAFAKMAVIVMGKGDMEPTFRNRTIFRDVRSDHWARGFVNLAATGEGALIRGNGGYFYPENNINFGEAVTLVMRMLGYTDADAGLNWPMGYVELAAQMGLTEGLNLNAQAAITRAQAAHLFCNLLNTPKKEGGRFCDSLGTVTSNAVILALDVTADDGTAGAVRTSEGVMKVKSGVVPQSILGQKGNLIVNAKGEIITLVPTGGDSKTITVSAASTGRLTDSGGTQYTIPQNTPAYTSEGKDTYENVWVDIAAGMRVTLYFSAGKVTLLYLNTAAAEDAVVVTGAASAATFRGLTGGAMNYPIYKNGQKISYSDIQPYDVVTFAAGALTVSSMKVTGTYENVSPNVEYPNTVTVMGHPFAVLDSAVNSLSGFKLGQTMTILLTADGQVAAAYSPSQVQGETLAIAKSDCKVDNEHPAEAEFTLLGNEKIELKGLLTGTPVVKGQLVKLSSYEKGKIRAEKLPSNTAPGSFNVQTMKLGSYTVATGVVLGDRVSDGPVSLIALEDLAQTTIPSSKISYYHLNNSNQVDVLIFNDVTGDSYEYGLLKSQMITYDDYPFTNLTKRVMTVEYYNTKHDYTGGGSVSGGTKVFGGVAAGANNTVLNWVTLTALKNVPRSAFSTVDGKTWFTHNGESFPVSAEVQCYNNVSGTWFGSLTECRAFSNNLTVYYDRAAGEGGKIRVVVAN